MAYTFPTVELSAAPSSADVNDQKYELGAIAKTEDGKVYRYVQCDVADAVDWAAGHPVGYVLGGTTWECSADFSDATSLMPVGIATATVDVSAYTDGTDTVYQWVQIGGLASVTGHDGNIANGKYVVWHDDGTVDEADVGADDVESHYIFGQVVSGGSTTALTIVLMQTM